MFDDHRAIERRTRCPVGQGLARQRARHDDRRGRGAGARLLAERLTAPLTAPAAINLRLDSVGWLADEADLRDGLRALVAEGALLDRLGIETVPPCVNRSLATFSVKDGRVVYALGALKNVGVEAMRAIVEARGDKPFATLFDLARRVDLKRVGKRPLEMLARAGAFDSIHANRAQLVAAADTLIAYAQSMAADRASASSA